MGQDPRVGRRRGLVHYGAHVLRAAVWVRRVCGVAGVGPRRAQRAPTGGL